MVQRKPSANLRPGRSKPSVWRVADVAQKAWNAGLVEIIDDVYAYEYASTMVTDAACCALWADASHDDDAEGTGEYQSEVDELRLGWSPDYEDALPPDVLADLRSDVATFVAMAWPYLCADKINAHDAGHDFHLTRNHHGTGFWDRGYEHGGELTDLAHTFGSFGLQVTGHSEDIRVSGSHS